MGVFPRFYAMTITHAHTTLFIEATSLSPTHNQQIGHGIACSFRLMKEEPGVALAAATDTVTSVVRFYGDITMVQVGRTGFRA